MHRRYDHINIPIEIVRTLVAVAECGSFTKAGYLLKLSQPAISAQIKRLQAMVGDDVFCRNQGGTTVTARGAIILNHARKMLEANDQILSLGGATGGVQPIRIGLSTLYATDFFKNVIPGDLHEQVTFSCGETAELERGLADGYLDVICVLNPSGDSAELADDWIEDFVWVRSRNFVVSPGSAIPIVGSSDRSQDQLIVQALEKNGLAYRVVFTSHDYGSRLAAVATGIGTMGLPRRHAKAPLIIAKDYYLPPLKSARAGIRGRDRLPADRIEKAVQLLMKLVPEAASSAAA